MRKLRASLCHAFFAASCGAIILFSSPTYGATISVTPSWTPANGDAHIGGSNYYVSYTPSGASTTVTSSYVPITLGTFHDFAASNPDVTPTLNFSLTLAPTITSPTIPATPLTFYGSLDGTTGVITFSTNSDGTNLNAPLSIPTYPSPGPQTYVYQTIGSYEFGLDQKTLPLAGGKTITLYAFIAPSTPTAAPEPISAGLTGIAMAGLLGFALRRKLQASRS